MELVLFGIGVSILSEIISVVKKKLVNTPFEGSAAQIVVIIISLLGAFGELAITGQISYSLGTLGKTAATIWATAELYYLALGQWYATHTPTVPANQVPIGK